MTLFWTIAGIAIATPLLLLARVFLRRPLETTSDDNRAHNVSIARDRLAELKAEHDKGELSDEEFTQGSRDLEVALAEDLSTEEFNRPIQPGDKAGRVALLISVIAVPLITVGLYQRIGAPQFLAVQGPGTPAVSAAHSGVGGPGAAAGQQLPSVDELVAQLENRLEQDPDNAEGWMLLGRTYMKLERFVDATRAYQRLAALAPGNPNAMLALADALAMQNNGRVGARSEELVLKALQIAPDSVTALWMAGKAAADRGENAAAAGYWQKAHPLLAGAPAMQQRMAALIREVGGTLPAGAAAAPALPQIMPTAERATAAATDPAAAGPRVPVEVALDAALFEQTDPGDLVYIFAIAVQGPPMPLAVARHTVAELPLKVELTDAMAMMPAMRISQFDKVQISARISRSGQPTAQAGDLESAPQVVETANPGSVQLLINSRVQ